MWLQSALTVHTEKKQSSFKLDWLKIGFWLPVWTRLIYWDWYPVCTRENRWLKLPLNVRLKVSWPLHPIRAAVRGEKRGGICIGHFFCSVFSINWKQQYLSLSSAAGNMWPISTQRSKSSRLKVFRLNCCDVSASRSSRLTSTARPVDVDRPFKGQRSSWDADLRTSGWVSLLCCFCATLAKSRNVRAKAMCFHRRVWTCWERRIKTSVLNGTFTVSLWEQTHSD